MNSAAVAAGDEAAQYQRLTAMERMLAIHLEVRGDIPGAIKEVTDLKGKGNEIATLKHWRDALLKLNEEDATLSPMKPSTASALNRYLDSEWDPVQSLLNQEEREV